MEVREKQLEKVLLNAPCARFIEGIAGKDAIDINFWRTRMIDPGLESGRRGLCRGKNRVYTVGNASLMFNISLIFIIMSISPPVIWVAGLIFVYFLLSIISSSPWRSYNARTSSQSR